RVRGLEAFETCALSVEWSNDFAVVVGIRGQNRVSLTGGKTSSFTTETQVVKKNGSAGVSPASEPRQLLLGQHDLCRLEAGDTFFLTTKEMAGSDTRKILVVILGSRSRYLYEIRFELIPRARRRETYGGRCSDTITGKPGLELLVRCKPAPGDVDISAIR